MKGNNIVGFSDAAMIAIHALTVLPASDAGELLAGRDLSARIAAPENHVAKVMQRLVRAGLAASTKGPSGGFRLGRDAKRITIREILETIDGPMDSGVCPFRHETCDRSNCVFGRELDRHVRELLDYFGKRTLADAISGR